MAPGYRHCHMLKLRIERVGALIKPPDPNVNPGIEVWRDNEGLICAYGEMLGEECHMHLPGLASFRFSAGGDEIAAVVPASIREECVVDAYLRKVLPMALQVGGREVLHASAVRSPAGVIGLCAVSETGKSTIAYALSQQGYHLWADDALVFDISERGGRAISLPFEVRLRPGVCEFFKVNKSRANRLASSEGLTFDTKTAPLAAICVLNKFKNRNAPAVSLRRISGSEAFAGVLTHAHCFSFEDVERKSRMMQNYLNLVATTPIFELSFQTGLANLPEIFDAIDQIAKQCDDQAVRAA
jgi:hypothetical protein